jgi:hypothetical protein
MLPQQCAHSTVSPPRQGPGTPGGPTFRAWLMTAPWTEARHSSKSTSIRVETHAATAKQRIAKCPRGEPQESHQDSAEPWKSTWLWPCTAQWSGSSHEILQLQELQGARHREGHSVACSPFLSCVFEGVQVRCRQFGHAIQLFSFIVCTIACSAFE